VSPKCMKVRDLAGSSVLDLTWKPDHIVALVSRGDRADQCCKIISLWPRAHVSCAFTHHQGYSGDCERFILFTLSL
jgi:hypothetical protein